MTDIMTLTRYAARLSTNESFINGLSDPEPTNRTTREWVNDEQIEHVEWHTSNTWRDETGEWLVTAVWLVPANAPDDWEQEANYYIFRKVNNEQAIQF